MLIKTATALTALSLSSQAFALSITVDTVSANWNNLVGGSNISYVNTDGLAGNEEIRWGVGSPVATVNSGYRFDSAAPPSMVVNTGDVFSFGNLTHFNNPIFSGGGISGAQLNITTDLTIGGVPLTEGPFTFSFIHNETPNSCSPQPNCANDIVSFSNLVTSDTFTVAGQMYTLNLLGFSYNGVTTNSFSSPEGGNNTAQLLGSFSAPIVTVPEPSTLGIFALSMVGLASFRLRRQS